MVFQIVPAFIGGLTILNRLKPASGNKMTVIEDSTVAPPFLNIPFEATNNPSIKISGYSQPDTKIEIYVDDVLKATVSTDIDGNFSSDSITLSLGNNQITGKTVRTDGRRSYSSKPITVYYSNEKPQLDLKSPSDNQLVQGDRRISVSGTTASDGVAVTVNGIRLIVDSAGNFSRTFELQDGDNNFVVVATNEAGNASQISRKVTYQSPSPTSSPAPTAEPTPQE